MACIRKAISATSKGAYKAVTRRIQPRIAGYPWTDLLTVCEDRAEGGEGQPR